MRRNLRLAIAAVLSSLTALLLVGCGQQDAATNSNTAAQQGAAANSKAPKAGTQLERTYHITEQGVVVDNRDTPLKDGHGDPIILLDSEGKAMKDGGTPIFIRGGSVMVIDTSSAGFEDGDHPGNFTAFFSHVEKTKQVIGGKVTYRIGTDGQGKPINKTIDIPPPVKGQISIVLDYH